MKTPHSNPINEIVNRAPHLPLEVPEMEMVVAEYIRKKKNIQVAVNIGKNINFSEPVEKWGLRYRRQVAMLSHAFGYAKTYFQANPY